jgi:hypothetical protein
LSEQTAGHHTRFEAVRLRLEAFDPGTGWRLWLYEFLLFGFKQGWACLFGGLLHALLLGEAAAHGSPLAPDTLRQVMALDIRLNAAGLLAWLQARAAGR